jgi:hypothetical protein
LIINTSIISNKKNIFSIIKQATLLGFYDISILVDSKTSIMKDKLLFKTGITNIQIDIVELDIKFVEELLVFSKKYSPQFRIDLDIFIYNYSKESLNKLEKIKSYLPNNFISLFFIYN